MNKPSTSDHNAPVLYPKTQNSKPRRCRYCGSMASVVWVHGHGQCAACGINVQECCRGEQCDTTLK